jgi:ABC-type glycerol-3-phosphate transport system substrate-binding protein
MNRKVLALLAFFVLILLASCGAQNSGSSQEKLDSHLEESITERIEAAQTEAVKSEKISKEDEEKPTEINDYSVEYIKHALVWLALAPNQDLDVLYVDEIAKGESLNTNVEESAVYPEDVIQLTGTRFVDGSITYSENDDGSINVYQVPLRWESSTPKDYDEEAMKVFTESIVDNTELVEIDKDKQEEIEILKLLKKIENQSEK